MIVSKVVSYLVGHFKIINALMFREATTRYGRDNIGLLWVIGEPLLFATGVFIMWSLVRPPYDNGISLLTFLITGYPPLILIRHIIGAGVNAVSVNANLLYHRKITILHIFIARGALEVIGATLSSVLLALTLILMGRIEAPKLYSIIYLGWFLLAWLSFGLSMILGFICAIFEWFEKFASLLSYVLIPISGAFYMVFWIPYQYRYIPLSIPFVNCMEMIRRGFLGEYYPTFYSISYVVGWAVIMTVFPLFLLVFVRKHIEVQ